ncbi:FAD-dependent oxidoreductase [Dolichospermum sp. LEGE 00240]|uniref:FAD-dependent oxidoreductase n=1 Tax=Dolichospermum sp. LEGE 00240 TaxID=1828603 RepID=UPI0018829448|nr:FAD-dependent oxidoreductase [Dolichospermum sp. LEGE 00240]MBE9251149.1 FAD-dependent oxidoreductase [Dolichospermum sp. LEGE 00240]MDM3847215.1 FAD-dependent oxidoreductase [Aphanizomenon gracile PMC638.10]
MTNNKFDLNTKICIIGAGASGLTVAYVLRKKGYNNITILEKENQAGGKCRTIVYKDRYFELGAGAICSDYNVTLEIMKELGVESKAPAIPNPIFLNNNGLEIKSSPLKTIKFIWQLLFKFSCLLFKNRKFCAPGLSNIPEELYENFDSYCRKNNLSDFAQTLNIIVSPFGYGYFDTIPTAYYLKYFTFTGLVEYFITKRLQFFVEGAGSLWQKLSKQFNVLFAENIISIKRTNKVYIQTQTGNYEFDKLILACPLDNALDFLDATSIENELFCKIQYNNYYTFAFIINKFPFTKKDVDSGVFIENMTSKDQGKIMFFYRRYLDSEFCTFYVIGNQEHNEQQLKLDVENQLKNMGFIIDKEYVSIQWKYFPHVSSEDMKDGFYDKLERIQGQNNMYLAGEIMNFPSLRGVTEYSNYLINKYF